MDKSIVAHFQITDPRLFTLIPLIPPIFLLPSTTYFEDLVESIVQQQLSEKAGDTIWSRFQRLFPEGTLTSGKVLLLPDEKIRSVGISWSKVKYIKCLAQAVVDKTLLLEKLPQLDDEEVIMELTKVKGIGRWTAEMFLMFTLGRPDVFSHGDLGLRNAIKKLYGFKKDPSWKTVERLSNKWKPYRTYACRILWKSLES